MAFVSCGLKLNRIVVRTAESSSVHAAHSKFQYMKSVLFISSLSSRLSFKECTLVADEGPLITLVIQMLHSINCRYVIDSKTCPRPHGICIGDSQRSPSCYPKYAPCMSH